MGGCEERLTQYAFLVLFHFLQGQGQLLEDEGVQIDAFAPDIEAVNFTWRLYIAGESPRKVYDLNMQV